VVDKLQLNDDPQLLYTVATKYEVPELASVTIKLYPVMIGAFPSVSNPTIEEHMKKAMVRYVQAGVKINYSIEDAVTVPATVMVDGLPLPLNLLDGLDFPELGQGARLPLNDEEKAFFTHAASTATDDIEVFYINKFSDEVTGGLLTVKGFSYT
jgi:hypothetical protein